MLGQLEIAQTVLVIHRVAGEDPHLAVVVNPVARGGPGAAPVRGVQDRAHLLQVAGVDGAWQLCPDAQHLLLLPTQVEVESSIVPYPAQVAVGVDEVAPVPLLEQSKQPVLAQWREHLR